MSDKLKAALDWAVGKVRAGLRFLAANNPNFVIVQQKIVTAILTGTLTWLSTKLPALFDPKGVEASVASLAPAIVIALGVWIAKAQDKASAKRKKAAVVAAKIEAYNAIAPDIPLQPPKGVSDNLP